MKHIKKLALQNKNNGYTIMESILIFFIVGLLILILIPGLTKYVDISNRSEEIGIADSIYKSSLTAVTNEYIVAHSTKEDLHKTSDTIYKLSVDAPLVQDILRGMKNNIPVEVYSYTDKHSHDKLPDNPTNSWLVFVKSNNGIVDATGDIYVIAPESLNCYSNGKFKLNLSQN